MLVKKFLTIYSAVKEIVLLTLHSHLMVALEENKRIMQINRLKPDYPLETINVYSHFHGNPTHVF